MDVTGDLGGGPAGRTVSDAARLHPRGNEWAGADCHDGPWYGQNVRVPPAPASPTTVRPDTDVEVEETVDVDRPWIALVWNDPINLMSYVAFVFQKLFGYSKDKANALMLDVHHKGRAVVASGAREKIEMDVFRLHEHGLWATMQQDD